jgi:hypothetical protein
LCGTRAERARRIRELIGAKAWTDAALATVELAGSRAVRRLSRDDGEWRCTIGSQWPVPDWLDDAVEFGHAALPLAILGALVETLARNPVENAPMASVPQSRSDLVPGTCMDRLPSTKYVRIKVYRSGSMPCDISAA